MDLNEPDLKSRGRLKSTPTVNESSPSIGRTSSDTGISGESTGTLFPEWTCSAEASLAKTSALPASEQALPANAQGSGVNTSEPFAHFDLNTSSWKTYQVSLLTSTWDVFSETWPRAGTMRNGIAYQQVPLAPLTGEIGSGLWPTPEALNQEGYQVANGKKYPRLGAMVRMWPTPNVCGGGNPPELLIQHGNHFVRKSGKKAHLALDQAVKMWPTPASNNGTGGCTGLAGGSGNRKKLYAMLGEEEGKKLGCQSLNPYWVEWLMGYPIGWTDLGDSATPLFRKSRNGSDGKS